MIIFHEGLPRSGKSYEAVVMQIIPMLKKGRKVFAYIEGLNHQKIAELCEITEEECRELLIQINREDVLKIYDVVENDSFVVIDELQNFFPSGRAKLDDKMTQLITEHGHRGLDILCMGQSLADCHNMWKRRTERKISFLKLSMVGKANSYKWTAYQGMPNGKGDVQYTKTNSGTRKYEEKYFGSYKSHTDGTENTDNHEDDRNNIFKSSIFTFWLPVFLVVLGVAVYYISQFFGGDSKPVIEEKTVSKQVSTETNKKSPNSNSQFKRPSEQNQIKQRELEFLDPLVEADKRYNPQITYVQRYGAVIWDMIVVFVDSQGRVKHRFYRDEILQMGYKIRWTGYGVEVIGDTYKALYRESLRHESFGMVPTETRDSLGGQ